MQTLPATFMDNLKLCISPLNFKMYKLLIAILTLSIYSCKTSVDLNKLDQDTQEIYNLSLDITTGSDTIVRYHLRIPPTPSQLYGDKVGKQETVKYQKRIDSLKAMLDTIQLFVVVNHKIDTLHSSDVQNILETITSNKSNLDYKMKGDTSFNETLIALCNNKISFDTIEVTELKTQFNYEIYSDRVFPNDKYRQIGTVSFSKVAFSNKKDKAAIYTSFMCGRLCGTGQILFFEKKNSKWQYIRTWEMWVS
jgi:hypothetical protein